MSDRKMLIVMLFLIAVIAVLVIIFYGGCARTVTSVPNSEYDGPQCQTLYNQKDGLIWASAFASGLTGVGGLTTSISENQNVRLGVGISTAVIGAVASSLIVISKVKSNEFEQYCNVETIDVTDAPDFDYQIKDSGL